MYFFKTWSQGVPLCSRVHSEFCILCVLMTQSPLPSTRSLQPLIPTTSHNNNNNDGGLHSCVGAKEDFEPIIVSRAKYSAALSICRAKKDYRQPTIHFLLLAVFSFFFFSLFTARKLYVHTQSLILRF